MARSHVALLVLCCLPMVLAWTKPARTPTHSSLENITQRVGPVKIAAEPVYYVVHGPSEFPKMVEWLKNLVAVVLSGERTLQELQRFMLWAGVHCKDPRFVNEIVKQDNVDLLFTLSAFKDPWVMIHGCECLGDAMEVAEPKALQAFGEWVDIVTDLALDGAVDMNTHAIRALSGLARDREARLLIVENSKLTAQIVKLTRIQYLNLQRPFKDTPHTVRLATVTYNSAHAAVSLVHELLSHKDAQTAMVDLLSPLHTQLTKLMAAVQEGDIKEMAEDCLFLIGSPPPEEGVSFAQIAAGGIAMALVAAFLMLQGRKAAPKPEPTANGHTKHR